MDVDVAISNGILVCNKENHSNEPIVMIDVGEGVPEPEKFLCFRCFENKRQASTYISIKEVEKLIDEKLDQTSQKLQETSQLIIKGLLDFQSHVSNLKTKVLKQIDQILQIVSDWIQELKIFGIKPTVSHPFCHINVLQSNHFQDKQNQILQNNKSHFEKINLILQKLMQKEIYQNCQNYFLGIVKKNISQDIEIDDRQLISQKNIKFKSIRYQLINCLKQEEYSHAIAFNQQSTIMVSGFDKDIKLWKFEKGAMIEKNRLNGNGLSCVVFSKKNNWFATGSHDCKIRCWKEEQDETWVSIQSEKSHQQNITCLLLNQKEDEIISSSSDQTIQIWSVDCQLNQIKNNQILEKKHTGEISSISMNDSETALISCGDDQKIILWNKLNQLWIYKNHIEMEDLGKRISFISENQIIWQQYSKGITHILEMKNGELIRRLDLNLELNQQKYDEWYFPTIVNKSKKVIIQKHSQFVYILLNQGLGKLQIAAQPIDCNSKSNYGALTEDGQYLTIWNKGTSEFKIYQIIYDQ